jgi:Phage protein Gp19/Gp15/Gp42
VAVYATVDDLRDSYFEGDIAASLDEKLTVKLDEAEEIVSSYLPNGDIPAWIAAGNTNAKRVRMVLCSMVLRVLRNPTGANTQSAGPFSMTLDKAVASGKLWLTRDDRRLLGLRRGAQSVEIVDDALPLLARSPHRLFPVIRSNGPEPEDDW